MGKKKKGISWMLAVFGILLLCGMASCGKKQTEPNIPLQDLLTQYPLENMLSFDVTEDGTVYGVNLDLPVTDESEYKLHRFNAQGEDEECVSLKDYFMVGTLALSEDEEHLYFTAQNDTYGVELYLFDYALEDGSISMLCELPYFNSVKQAAVVGDVIYLLGKSPNWQTKEPPGSGYPFEGERLVSYHLPTGEQTQLGFDFPINMAAGGTGTLMVSGYLDEVGYCLMEYDPKKDSMQVAGKMEEYKFDRFAVCGDGREVIYGYQGKLRGLVLSEINHLSVETELFPEADSAWSKIVYAGGRVYCKAQTSGMLISFPLAAVQRGNKELSFIARENSTKDTPYGCGYKIQRMELTDEKFTLKVLARDRDYDLCLGDTLESDGRNLYENGVFYPLNDVPGMEEYLARCFPYVREVATKEDGTIWMLPVRINVLTLMASRAAQEESGLILRENMTWEEFKELLCLATEEQRARIFMPKGYVELLFCEQYFSRYHTLTEELFTQSVPAIAGIWAMDCGKGVTPENLLMEVAEEAYWLRVGGRLVPYIGEDAVLVGMPKLAASDKNIASCVYLAVNPDSARLDETLAYLADLIAYMMRGGDIPYFTDWEPKHPLDEALYKVYADAEIAFGVDADVYEAGMEELLSGTISVEEYIQQTEPKLKMYWGE